MARPEGGTASLDLPLDSIRIIWGTGARAGQYALNEKEVRTLLLTRIGHQAFCAPTTAFFSALFKLHVCFEQQEQLSHHNG